jgi:hypothetical protein
MARRPGASPEVRQRAAERRWAAGFAALPKFSVWSSWITAAIPLVPPMARTLGFAHKAPFGQSAPFATTPYRDRAASSQRAR